MRAVPGWDEYFMGIAQAAKLRSKDPNTQVGALIVSQDRRRTVIGYNGMPEGMVEGSCWEDTCKHDLVVHAEHNAIANAARTGVPVNGATMYVTLHPCLPCARLTVAAGITRIIYSLDDTTRFIAKGPHWSAKFDEVMAYCKRNRVHLEAIRCS